MQAFRSICALLVAACGALQPAAAAVVSGSFSGIARDELSFSIGPATPTFEGASVQGRFYLDTELLGPQTLEDPDFATYRLTGAALLLEFSVGGTTYRFGDQGLASIATVYTGLGGQALMFVANALDVSYPAAALRLGGTIPDGASRLYVDGVDLRTFSPGPVTDDGFNFAAFQLSDSVGAAFALTMLRFDTPNAVPEPAGWALLLAGLSALAWARRQR